MTRNDYLAVNQLFTTYFDGLYYSDVARLEQVFSPLARYISVSSGKQVNLDMSAYFDVVKQRKSPASLHQVRRDQVLSVEFVGPATAMAKVYCVIHKKHFTDLLSLIFIDGQWQIISKVFHYDIHPQPCDE